MNARNKKSFVDLTVDDDEDEDIIITAVVKKSRACSGEIVDLLENDDGIDKDSMDVEVLKIWCTGSLSIFGFIPKYLWSMVLIFHTVTSETDVLTF